MTSSELAAWVQAVGSIAAVHLSDAMTATSPGWGRKGRSHEAGQLSL